MHNGANSPLSIDLTGRPSPLRRGPYRINAGGAGVAGSPAWSADTAAVPSPYSNTSAGGNSATGTTAATIDMTHPSIPAGTPMSISPDRAVRQARRAQLALGLSRHAGAVRGAAVLRRNLYQAPSLRAPGSSTSRSKGRRCSTTTTSSPTWAAAEGRDEELRRLERWQSRRRLPAGGAESDRRRRLKLYRSARPTGTLTRRRRRSTLAAWRRGNRRRSKLTLTNTNPAGGAEHYHQSRAATISPSGQPFTRQLGPDDADRVGAGAIETSDRRPTLPRATTSHSATLTIPHNGYGLAAADFACGRRHGASGRLASPSRFWGIQRGSIGRPRSNSDPTAGCMWRSRTD